MENSEGIYWGEGTYTVTGNQIRFTGVNTEFDYEDTEYDKPYNRTVTFSLSGNTLTITYENGNSITLTKQ